MDGPTVRPYQREASESENGALCASGGEMRETGGLHTLAKTVGRSAFTIADQKQSPDDGPEK